MDNNTKFSIKPYTAEKVLEWNDFVDSSRNGTFLLRREYMDYHADRFEDWSLMIYKYGKEHSRPSAIFAACKSRENDRKIVAHEGLTYGGLIIPFSGIDAGDVVEIMQAIIDYYRSQGFDSMRYKCVPHIYYRYPAEEDIYALFRCGARLAECNISSTIDLAAPVAFDQNSRRNTRKAINTGLTVGQSDNFEIFWNILSTLLHDRYETKPVHSATEMQILADRFPENIKLITAKNASGEMIAGTILYITDTCVHCQYIASSEEGKNTGALPLIFNKIVSDGCFGRRYFDFGTSNENHGLYLNRGLLMQKNGMGGRGITYNIYELDF